MFVQQNQATQLARLFSLLAQGERLAHHSATQQSRMMLNQERPSQAKFLKTQAKQELFHARVFDGTITWLDSNQACTPYRCLEKYSGHLETSLKQGAMTESILATQVVLESLGKLALQGIDNRMNRYSFGLKKIRSTILAQEDQHHDFGQSELHRFMQEENMDLTAVQNLAYQYLELAFEVLDEVEPLFESLDSNSHRFKQDLIGEMPSWLNLS